MHSHRYTPSLMLAAALALSLSLAPAAHGKRKKKQPEPPPAAAFRCSLPLPLPDGREPPVVAWGPDEAAARGQVRRVARLVAEVHAHPDSWSALLHPGTEAATSFAARLQRVPADVSEGGVFPLPSYEAGVPTCVAETLPFVADATGWEVAWTQDADEPVRRSEAATALEAARRRACLLPYQREMAGLWRALATVEPGQRQTLFSETWNGSRDGFVACMSTTELHDAALSSEPGFPWIRPAGGSSAPPIVPERPEVLYDGFECVASEFSTPGPGSTALGWGQDIEWARETAMGPLVTAVSRDAFATVALGLDSAEPDTLPSLIAGQALRLTQIVPPTASVEWLQLRCSDQLVGVEGDPSLRWSPAAQQARDICAAAGDWSVATQSFAGQPRDPFDVLLAMQQRLVYPGMRIAREAWEQTGGDATVAVHAQGVVALCEASSLGEVAIDGGSATPMPDGYSALRASPELSRALLDKALAESDLARLVAVIHPQQRPANLTLYERILASDGDPLPFWEQMVANLPAALADGRLVWGEFEGGWLLVPSDTR
ncbi:MAG: hypothetical protein QGH45_18270 [Myxococcota bacterium]|nr:hypothetical protein [Myxococcota bacterium]